ncbi:MAG: hypothetical protein Q7T97_00300 [Burkholderiaceae bacterium]|nr:hypothetical protein [Burkholderiaceae bacterium]
MFSIPKAASLPMCVLAGLHFMSTPVAGQTAPAASLASVVATPQAADPTAAIPAALYRSPFAGYRSLSETTVAPWRDTNERVRQRGGWRAYAREANGSASPSASAPAQTPASPDSGHSGHRMK